MSLALELSDVTDGSVQSFACTISYDPTRLDLTGYYTEGGLLDGMDWTLVVNTEVPGEITVVGAGANPLVGSGPLLHLTGSGLHWGETTLDIQQFILNEGSPGSTLPGAPASLFILGMGIDPPTAARGLQTPTFEAVEICCGEMDWEWIAFPGMNLLSQTPLLILDPPPEETTEYRVTATHRATGKTVTGTATILVGDPLYFDLDGDGCNTLSDLVLLFENWSLAVDPDPNGDGFLDIRDFLYINLDGCLPQ